MAVTAFLKRLGITVAITAGLAVYVYAGDVVTSFRSLTTSTITPTSTPTTLDLQTLTGASFAAGTRTNTRDVVVVTAHETASPSLIAIMNTDGATTPTLVSAATTGMIISNGSRVSFKARERYVYIRQVTGSPVVSVHLERYD